jgi:hypothetical protein
MWDFAGSNRKVGKWREDEGIGGQNMYTVRKRERKMISGEEGRTNPAGD